MIDPAMQAMCSARTSNFDDNVGKKREKKENEKKILRAILFLCYDEFEMEFRLEF